MLIAIGIISGTKRRLKKSFLEEIFNIWLYHQCCEFHLQCWWWWECEIVLVKDFTTSPQMRFLRAEAWLGSKMGTGLGSLWNGWYMLFSLTFEPTSWARIEICCWRFSPFVRQEQHLLWWSFYDQSFYYWWLKFLENCIIKRAKQSYWWRIGDIRSPIYYQTFW
jgi:hypothetical protein